LGPTLGGREGRGKREREREREKGTHREHAKDKTLVLFDPVALTLGLLPKGITRTSKKAHFPGWFSGIIGDENVSVQ
jgi:hypothetical protein